MRVFYSFMTHSFKKIYFYQALKDTMKQKTKVSESYEDLSSECSSQNLDKSQTKKLESVATNNAISKE